MTISSEIMMVREEPGSSNLTEFPRRPPHEIVL